MTIDFKELDCINYNIAVAQEKIRVGEYGHANIYLENAQRSLRELEHQKKLKNVYDEIEQMDERSQKYIVRQLSAIYE